MDFKHKYELETGNSIYSGNGQLLPYGSYSDEFVEYLLKQLTIHNIVKSFYCQTKRCDKTKNKQCDECALQELNDTQ